MKYKFNLSVLIIWIVMVLLSGCKVDTIKLLNPRLNVSNIVEYLDNKEVRSDVYFKFDFRTSESLLKLSENTTSLIQIRLKLIKDNKEIFYTIADGPYSIAEGNLTKIENSNGSSYSALFFQSLNALYSETGKVVSVEKIDFDTLEIQVVYPLMLLGTKFKSDVVVYTRDDMFRKLSNKRDIIKIQ